MESLMRWGLILSIVIAGCSCTSPKYSEALNRKATAKVTVSYRPLTHEQKAHMAQEQLPIAAGQQVTPVKAGAAPSQTEPSLTYADLVRVGPEAEDSDTMDLPPGRSAHEEPQGLILKRGVLPWGVSVREAKQLHDKRGQSYNELFCSDYSSGEAHCTQACCIDFGDGTWYSPNLRFYKDRLFEYTVTFSPEAFPLIARVFENRLGKPVIDRESTVQNSMGATFDQHEKEWGMQNTVVKITKRGGRGKVTLGRFVVTYLPIAQEIEVRVPSRAPF